MTDCWAWLNEETEKDFLAQCYTGEDMLITAPNTYRTAKERKADYTKFLADLAKCETHAAISLCKADYLDMFSKLRNEKDENYTYHGFDYLENIETAIERQQQLIGE